ncbi:DUF3592 domain-containing protein [Actinomadura sp. KC345]|uniref:DUF3592 domain-containing protein n=1 Tax=Actinomadura sp. KC345 TaxID=2530371 RepID=UPI0010489E6A|nr:DUF3592 domain-containing protein [Actinomadura sp. KC345]TDC57151.1 DUF3592 domain-containing protein [Actinomadura sp. KC345]
MNPDHVVYWLPPGFVLFGSLFVVFGVHIIRVGRHLRRFGRRASGVVVRMTSESTGSGRHVDYPTVRFRTRDGAVIETSSDLGGNLPMFREGQPVTVLYDPDEPERARLDGAAGSGTLHGAAFIAVGLLFAAIGAAGTAATAVAALG